MNRIEVNVVTGGVEVIPLTDAEIADAQERTAAETTVSVRRPGLKEIISVLSQEQKGALAAQGFTLEQGPKA